MVNMYDEQIQQHAPSFSKDQCLRQEVLEVVQQLLQEMGCAPFTIDVREATIEHQGITFHVSVSLDKVRGSSPHTVQRQRRETHNFLLAVAWATCPAPVACCPAPHKAELPHVTFGCFAGCPIERRQQGQWRLGQQGQ